MNQNLEKEEVIEQVQVKMNLLSFLIEGHEFYFIAKIMLFSDQFAPIYLTSTNLKTAMQLYDTFSSRL